MGDNFRLSQGFGGRNRVIGLVVGGELIVRRGIFGMSLLFGRFRAEVGQMLRDLRECCVIR